LSWVWLKRDQMRLIGERSSEIQHDRSERDQVGSSAINWREIEWDPARLIGERPSEIQRDWLERDQVRSSAIDWKEQGDPAQFFEERLSEIQRDRSKRDWDWSINWREIEEKVRSSAIDWRSSSTIVWRETGWDPAQSIKLREFQTVQQVNFRVVLHNQIKFREVQQSRESPEWLIWERSRANNLQESREIDLKEVQWCWDNWEWLSGERLVQQNPCRLWTCDDTNRDTPWYVLRLRFGCINFKCILRKKNVLYQLFDTQGSWYYASNCDIDTIQKTKNYMYHWYNTDWIQIHVTYWFHRWCDLHRSQH
jgi:hypothetical protein